MSKEYEPNYNTKRRLPNNEDFLPSLAEANGLSAKNPVATIADTRQTINDNLILEGTTNASTSQAIYGVNIITTSTVADLATRLPDPVTGRTTVFVNNSLLPILVFPSVVGGEINGVVDGYAEIPPDGRAYTFYCTRNPVTGAWTWSPPATAQINIPEISIAHINGVATNNYGVNTFGTVSSVGVDGSGNMVLGGEWVSENDPTTLTKIKVYTNILQSDVPTGTITVALLTAYKTAASSATSGQRNTFSFKTAGYSGSFAPVGSLSSPPEVGDTDTLYDTQSGNPVSVEFTQLGTGGAFSRYYYQIGIFMPASAATKTYKFIINLEYF
jgi:hypothetical protein